MPPAPGPPQALLSMFYVAADFGWAQVCAQMRPGARNDQAPPSGRECALAQSAAQSGWRAAEDGGAEGGIRAGNGGRALIRRFAASASLGWPAEAIERGPRCAGTANGNANIACRRLAAVRHGQGLASTDESGNLDYGVVAFVCRRRPPARPSTSLAALLRANARALARASTHAHAHAHAHARL